MMLLQGKHQMEATRAMITGASIAITLAVVYWAWKVVNWLWMRPKRLEKLLRKQGLNGNSYRPFVGDVLEMVKMGTEATSKPMNQLSDDIVPRIFSFFCHTINKYGKNSFTWFGPTPRIIVTDPQLVKDLLNNNHDFPKPYVNPLISILVTGLVNLEGEKWNKHRRIINPAFHVEKLKSMLPTFFKICNDMINKWEEKLASEGGSCEMDVWPSLQNLTSEIISQTAFGNLEEGRRITELQKEQIQLISKVILKVSIPGWRFLPTSTKRRIMQIDREIEELLIDMITKREKAFEAGEATKNDLLGILLESNHKEIQEHGNNKDVGMTLKDVIEESKVFYVAGQETTSNLLVWTIVLLSRFPDWQARARDEVIEFFGNQKPDFDGLSHLKIVTMILYEVLRLYPPATIVVRTVHKDMKLGNLTLPEGVQIAIPSLMIHHDSTLWGDDANEFKPDRFSEGVLKATNGQVSFLPFGWGPRICIGQNFAILEAKMALALILQRFSFELSPAYSHAPITSQTLGPKYGAQVLLHRL
ncbi:hypothetical protein PIB30_064181 [Stylosanthes scabra]|uniref:Cytochrome P450 n=1 Tax=Stylosanthes scabra TaxID=79078 RepID=A0ABU6QLF5_9FABA|nr:hypothetical protein [Stylosanthes scabra]